MLTATAVSLLLTANPPVASEVSRPTSAPISPPTPVLPTVPAPPSAVATQTESYALSILAADALGIAATVPLSGLRAGGLAVVPYLAAAPIVHLIHRQPGHAFASLLLHAGLPLAGGIVGYAIERPSCHDEFLCGFGGLVVGGMVGMVGATVIDASVLAKKTVEVPRRVSGLRVVPTIGYALSGPTIGLFGSF